METSMPILAETFLERGEKPEMSSLHGAYALHYASALQSWIEKVCSEVHRRLPQNAQSNSRISRNEVSHPTKRCSFNAEALPILERAFAENRYPTRTERARLAKDTGLDEKQVTVWFQNHRNRAKKESLVSQRPRSVSPAGTSHTTPAKHLPSETCSITFVSSAAGVRMHPSNHAPRQNNCLNSTDAIAPAHAYPSPYPPHCGYDPFPLHVRSSLVLPWPRRMTSRDNPSKVADDDLHAITTAFARLTIEDEDVRQAAPHPPTMRHPRSTRPISCMTATVPTCSPLPAIVRSHSSVQSLRHSTAPPKASLPSFTTLLSHESSSLPSTAHHRTPKSRLKRSWANESAKSHACLFPRSSAIPYPTLSASSPRSSRSRSSRSTSSFRSDSTTPSSRASSILDTPPSTPLWSSVHLPDSDFLVSPSSLLALDASCSLSGDVSNLKPIYADSGIIRVQQFVDVS
ncbi:homeodomain transcription factor [Phlebiopsis gigantea 11061_1 CR5-6]|uniref:Homeodomain transcription factor n=1 Tax=Phlebiopsis gigantea (strain 11061_1 CR5-6) TaxID=745531 RepID=A0A0C3PAZ7_PHLG1|nr:homeodomain transcription factor [Phlebiopsis gigantea 11061_1 CR5-6]